jgi:hypothetical protein
MTATAIAIYDGLELLGHVTEARSGRWEAHDADGAMLGSFPSRAAATDAVIRAARAFLPTVSE